jgi:hypothetical protein
MTMMKEENNPAQCAQGTPNQEGCNNCPRRNRHHHHQCWTNNNNPTRKFKGKTKKIKNDTFNNTGPHNAALFNKSLKNIASYLQLHHGNDVSKAVCNMAPVTIIIPPKPTGPPDPTDITKTLPVDNMDMQIWKRTFSKAHDCKDIYNKNMAKAFIVVYHQCSPALKNDLEATSTFASIHENQDVIGLLKLIQSLWCSYDAKTQSVMATEASHMWLFTHYQKDGVNNHNYHCKFLAHVETIKTYEGLGAVSVIPTFLTAKINNLASKGLITDAANPTDQEKAMAIAVVREEYLAALMLSGAKHDCFNELRNDLKNQYGYGKDRYLKITDACHSLLNRWTPSLVPSPQQRTPRNPPAPPKLDDNEALVFAQDAATPKATLQKTAKHLSLKPPPSDDTSSQSSKQYPPKKPTNVWCKNEEVLVHVSSVCPDAKPPTHVHAMADADNASIASDASSIIILAQQADCKPIDPNFLLLDSQSTVNLFSNPQLFENVHQAATPINFHCNKGSMPTTTVANFRGNEVYLSPNGIANVLSLFHLGKKTSHHLQQQGSGRRFQSPYFRWPNRIQAY